MIEIKKRKANNSKLKASKYYYLLNTLKIH